MARSRPKRPATTASHRPVILLPEEREPRPVPTKPAHGILGVDPPPPRRRRSSAARILSGLAVLCAVLAAVLIMPVFEGDQVPDSPQTTLPVMATSAGAPDRGAGNRGGEAGIGADIRTELSGRPFTEDPATGMRLILWRGDDQTGTPGRLLRSMLAVVLQDSAGRPVPGARIRFVVATGGGTVDPERVRTGDVGLASTVWWPGTDPDSLTVTAVVEDHPALTARFTASLASGADDVSPELAATDAAETVELSGLSPEAEAPSAPPTESAARVPPAADATPVTPAAAPRRALSFVREPDLAAGGVHSCRLGPGGAIQCWGGGRDPGQPSGVALRTVSGGVMDACGVTDTGAVACWSAGRGELPTAQDVIHLPDGEVAVSVVSGSEHRCALSREGAVFCWGSNTQGQLGIGGTTDTDRPTRVAGLPPATQLVAGWVHTCALSADGDSYCWGSNAAGQLGDGSTSLRARPVHAAPGGAFTRLAAGSAHSCGVTMDRRILCWGANAYGQLGAPVGSASTRPVEVQVGVGFRAVAAGGVHTCALTDSGAAFCWGRNTFGQLGDGTTDDSVRPVPVGGDLRFGWLSAGGAHTCGEARDGVLYCWGNNVQGQIGDRSRQNHSSPTVVRLR